MFKKRKKKQIEMIPFRYHWKEALMGVKRKAAVTAAQRLTLEKEMLLSGKKPKSIFSSAQQRTAVRLLSGFPGSAKNTVPSSARYSQIFT